MNETLKDFLAIVFASVLWMLVVLIIVAIYILFEHGPLWEELAFFGVVVGLFVLGVFTMFKHKRLQEAVQLPLFLIQ